MGKTLQTIATILDNRPKLQHSPVGAKHPPSCTKEMKEQLVSEENLWDQCKKDWDHEMKMINVPSSILPKKKKSPGGGARAGTLVVCPVIALSQWKVSHLLYYFYKSFFFDKKHTITVPLNYACTVKYDFRVK